MNNTESLKKVINKLNSGAKYPAMQLVKSNPEVAALVSKLIKSKHHVDFDINKESTYYNLNQSQIHGISDKSKTRIRDNENIVQLFPDIELAIQILVSSILSPKDMVKNDIIYKTVESVMPSEIQLKLNQEVKSHIEGYYKIHNELPVILRDALFNKGASIKAVLPESIVDEIINNNTTFSTESLSDLFTGDNPSHLGILGNPFQSTGNSYSLERFSTIRKSLDYNSKLTTHHNDKLHQIFPEFLDITDNYKLLKLPELTKVSNKNKLKSILKNKVSLEAYDASNTKGHSTTSDFSNKKDKLSSDKLTDMMYKDPSVKSQTFLVIPTAKNAKRKSVGRPLILNLPTEAVIPIYTPGDETKHIGYFVMTDTDGHPITINTNIDHIEGLGTAIMNQNQNQSLSSLLIMKAKRNLQDISGDITVDQITKVYSSIVEKDLVDRLKNGLYAGNVEIGDNEEIYRIMLARSLASKYTRLVFIPGELVGYFAFKYFGNGVGKSYLDDVKVLCSLRAIILFSKVMAMTKNSIALTHVNMTLDPNDPDPQKTIEIATHEIVKMRQQYFPLGINSPVDLVDWIQRAGFEFSFEGHPGLPQTKFDFETKNLQHILPESDLDDTLRKQCYMAFGLSPEVVDNGFNSEFATTVVSNNILLSKRVIQLQQVLTRQLSEYVKKILANDSIITKALMEILVSNKAVIEKSLSDEEKEEYNNDKASFLSDLLERYIEAIVLDLPKPDITSVETQISAYDQYLESLDKTIDAWVNAEFITSDFAGNISNSIDAIKSVVRNYYLRKWMSDNGFMAELNDIVTSDEDGNPTIDIFDLNKNHVEGVIRSSIRFIKSLENIKLAANKDLENMEMESGVSASDQFGDEGGSEEGSEEGGDDFGGDFDTGMGDEGGESEEPEATEEPAEPTTPTPAPAPVPTPSPAKEPEKEEEESKKEEPKKEEKK